MWQIVPFYYLILWPILLLPINFRALCSFVSSCPLISHFYVAPTMVNLHHALLFTATLQERLLCICNLAKSLRNEFHESQDVSVRDSANCRCDCENSLSSHEQPWWASCDRVERLQRFHEITNSDRDDYRKVHNAIAIEPVICSCNHYTLPQIARAIAMYFREWDREAHKKRPRCAVFR
jgi:hypothetical protein